MKKWLKICLLSLVITSHAFGAQAPRLAIVIVVDGFSHDTLQKLSGYTRGALSILDKNGVVYEQANFPHGMPATATGHVALSTGAYAHNHGIVGNYWYDKQGGTKIKCNSDTSEQAAVFSPDGLYDHGISSKHLLVDGFSDQYMLASTNHTKAVYAFSLKSRAAVGMGNHQGKCFWYDTNAGRMTSSKAYFEQLPTWLTQFNTRHPIATHQDISWRLMYPASSKAYQFPHARDDQFSEFLIQTKQRTLSINFKPTDRPSKYTKKHKWFEVTPGANKYLLDCALQCIKKELPHNQTMLVWISLSSSDKLGHRVGPHNIAMIDMIYHLDKQLKSFMRSVERLVKKKEDVLYVLTGDHGCMPIPEYLAQDGYPAKRVDSNKIMEQLNQTLKDKFDVDNLVKQYKTPQFFLDEVTLSTYPKEKQDAILKQIIQTLQAIPGIKQAWTFDELYHTTYPVHSFEEHFKQQLYPQRSGLITVQVQPYIQLTDYHLGTGHKTPYNYDTHVPLILYQPKTVEKKRIPQQVWTPQLAATLADLLELPKPSAATFGILPGISH